MCLSAKIWFEIGLKVKKMLISLDFYCCCMLILNGFLSGDVFDLLCGRNIFICADSSLIIIEHPGSMPLPFE